VRRATGDVDLARLASELFKQASVRNASDQEDGSNQGNRKMFPYVHFKPPQESVNPSFGMPGRGFIQINRIDALAAYPSKNWS
jgi:hypothetical protein